MSSISGQPSSEDHSLRISEENQPPKTEEQKPSAGGMSGRVVMHVKPGQLNSNRVSSQLPKLTDSQSQLVNVLKEIENQEKAVRATSAAIPQKFRMKDGVTTVRSNTDTKMQQVLPKSLPPNKPLPELKKTPPPFPELPPLTSDKAPPLPDLPPPPKDKEEIDSYASASSTEESEKLEIIDTKNELIADPALVKGTASAAPKKVTAKLEKNLQKIGEMVLNKNRFKLKVLTFFGYIKKVSNKALEAGITKVDIKHRTDVSVSYSIQDLAKRTGVKLEASLEEISKKSQASPNKKNIIALFTNINNLQKEGSSSQEIQKIMQDLDKNKKFPKLMEKNKELNLARNNIIINLYGGTRETNGMKSVLETISSPKIKNYLANHNEISGETAGGQTVNFNNLDIGEKSKNLENYNDTLKNIQGKEYSPYFDLLREVVGAGKSIPKVSDPLRGFVEGFIKHSGNKARREAFNQAWPTGDKAAPAQWEVINALIQENYDQLSA